MKRPPLPLGERDACASPTLIIKERGPSTDRTRVRALPVASFVVAALIAFLGAAVDAAQEAYITWDDRTPLGLTIFGVASLLAAGLALVPGARPALQVGGPLLLLPALFAINDSQFELAVSLALVGGALASGLAPRLRHPRSR